MSLPAAQSSTSHALKPAGAANNPIASLIPYTLHPADFQAAIKGCKQAAQPMRALDAKANPLQHRQCSIKTTGESHAKGGKARTSDTARPVLPAIQGRAADAGMT